MLFACVAGRLRLGTWAFFLRAEYHYYRVGHSVSLLRVESIRESAYFIACSFLSLVWQDRRVVLLVLQSWINSDRSLLTWAFDSPRFNQSLLAFEVDRSSCIDLKYKPPLKIMLDIQVVWVLPYVICRVRLPMSSEHLVCWLCVQSHRRKWH